MSNALDRRSLVRTVVLVFALVLPVVAVVAGVAVVGDDGRLPLAKGTSGGSFHPVAGDFKPDATELDGCGDDFRCLEQAFGNIAYREGPRAALTLFEKRIATNTSVEADCHRIAHTVGSAAFARFDGNVAKTFSQGSATCASGYYHGILERAFVGASSKAHLAKIARSLCLGQGIRRHGFLDYQCRHGLGHGLMIQTGYDLPLALSVCAGLGTGWDHMPCAGGVFMENLNTRYGFRSPWLRDDDPLYPCNSIEQRDKRACYGRAATRILELNRHDFAQAASTCARVASRWARFCFRGYGRDAAAAARYVPKKIVSLCRLGGAGEGDCVYGAARGVADRFKGTRRAGALCASVASTTRDECFSGLGLVLGLLNPTDRARRRACAKVSRRYADHCARSAVDEVNPNGLGAWG